jgi:serine/threonine protein phosphatase PrpC
MPNQLRISVGQHSDKGRKEINQDFHGVVVPLEPQLSLKGIAIAIADGISTSDVSHVASASSVTGFLGDYYCTAETWSVKKSAQRVLSATNSWLHSQTRRGPHRYDADRGYVCTFSAMVIKSTTAHLFHVGDSRIYRLRNRSLEQLTIDHRISVAQDTSYLSRALGMAPELEIDYQALPLEHGDLFLLATDGVYEYASAEFIFDTIKQHHDDLDVAAKLLVDEAYRRGSTDNLTAQIVRIEELPSGISEAIHQQLAELPFPPILEARKSLDDYTITRVLHFSSRSHVYLAVDAETKNTIVIKTPATDMQGDAGYLERFLMEEWIARRIDSAHVLKPWSQNVRRKHLYIVNEFIDGQTLRQWMIDNPKPALDTVRGIIEQIAKGVQAFHRKEMLHQDLRPENIMIDRTGTVKIIDFGSTRVAGVMEAATTDPQTHLLGTAQYSAPEYFIGEVGTTRSDLFSLGVIAYEMLTGKLPYGTQVAKTKTRAAQRKIQYRSLLDDDRAIPAWIDAAVRKAVQPDPNYRYEEMSEFIHDLREPNKALLNEKSPPLLERNPLLFWKCVCLVLIVVIGVLSYTRT